MGVRVASLAAAMSLLAAPSLFALVPGELRLPIDARVSLPVSGPGRGPADLFEYVYQDNNFASELLVGAGQSVDRASRIVP